MAAKDLITRARAYQALQGVTGVDSLLDTLITAASDAVARWCGRSFHSRAVEEVHDAGGEVLLLREYPVQAIAWIRDSPQVVLRVVNTATTVNQRATVAIASTGLILTRTASGVVTSSTGVTWATYPTLDQVANAVDALGNGWAGQAVADYALWPSADLYLPPAWGDGTQSGGALNARGQEAGLRMHIRERADFTWDPRGFVYLASAPWGECSAGVWDTYRVKYTAGYTTIPESVQQACADWVAHLYYRCLRDPALQADSSAPVSGTATYRTFVTPDSPPGPVAALLAPYRQRRV